MPTGYELAQEASKLLYEGHEDLSSAIDDWTELAEDKIAAYGAVKIALDKEVEQANAEARKWMDEKKRLQKEVDRIRERGAELIMFHVELHGHNPRHALVSRGLSVNILNDEYVPEQYITEKTVKSVDKKQIKDDLKNGVVDYIDGVELVEIVRAVWK